MALVRAGAIGICGNQTHRRCLSLAHNAGFEVILGKNLCARLESRKLVMGCKLIMQADRLAEAFALCALARGLKERTIL